MNLGTGNRNQTIMAAVLGVLALVGCVYTYEQIFGSDTPPPVTQAAPPAAAGPGKTATPAGHTAKLVGVTSAGLDPTLHMDAMRASETLAYAGVGRNIFSAQSVQPISIPKPLASARIAPAPAPLPCPPNCPPPPPPPPIDLKLFAVVDTDNKSVRKACLLQGENVYLAVAGDVVLKRYKVISVDARSVLVEDMQNNNRQTLPLLAN